jgi:hypothetical protein
MPVRLAAASDGPGLSTTGRVVGYDQNHPSRRRRLVIAHAHDKNMPPSMYEYFRGAIWQRRKYHDLAAKTYVEPEIADLSALIRQQCDLIEEFASLWPRASPAHLGRLWARCVGHDGRCVYRKPHDAWPG